MEGEVIMGDLYYNPCEKKDKKDECNCNVKVITKCDSEDKKFWGCEDKKDKKSDGCEVTVIINCDRKKDGKDY